MNNLCYKLLVFILSILLLPFPQAIGSQPETPASLPLVEIAISALFIFLLVIIKKLYGDKKVLTREIAATEKATNVGTWRWDRDTGKITLSNTAINIMGIKPEHKQLGVHEFITFIDKKDRKTTLSNLKRAVNSHSLFKSEFRCELGHPHKRWLDFRGKILFDQQGQPYQMIGMLQDITNTVLQRNMQEQMKQVLQNVIDHNNNEQLLSSLSSKIHEIEPALFCVIYLFTDKNDKLKIYHSDQLPEPFRFILKSISLADKDTELSKTTENGGITIIENLMEIPAWQSVSHVSDLSDSTNIVSYYGIPLLTDNQSFQGVIGLYCTDKLLPKNICKQILDLTSRIAAVAIEGQIQSDTQKQTLQQLYQSQKMDSLGHLTAGIAHDFNNILGSIVGYNSLAKKIAAKEGNEKLNSFLNEVTIASSRARDLINQMMIFSRSEPTKNLPMAPKMVIKEVLQLIKSMLPSSITIRSNLPDDISMISINPTALHQVMMNLLINAKDATYNELGFITVSLFQESLSRQVCSSCHETFAGDFVCIEVEDNGSGISPEIMQHIFNPFFSTKDIGSGTGMGLSVVHGIVHDSYGHMVVNSVPKPSPTPKTTFKLYFPAVGNSSQDNISGQQGSDDREIRGNGEHIMVVDDDTPLSLLFEEILKSYGYKVSRFDNSQVALATFEKQPDDFQLVLSDQTMPFIMGHEMVKQMKSVKPNLPVIICTGNSDMLDKTIAEEIGIKIVLNKPITINNLLFWINNSLHSDIYDPN